MKKFYVLQSESAIGAADSFRMPFEYTGVRKRSFILRIQIHFR